MIWVSETAVTDAAAVPKSTAVSPVNPVPVIVTCVPPVVGPAVGLTPVTPGAEVYVKSWAEVPPADMPPGAVTVTLTVPDPAGEVAVICVSEFTVNDGAAVDPKSTLLAFVNPVPVIVTGVPPASGPTGGSRPVTVGT